MQRLSGKPGILGLHRSWICIYIPYIQNVKIYFYWKIPCFSYFLWQYSFIYDFYIHFTGIRGQSLAATGHIHEQLMLVYNCVENTKYFGFRFALHWWFAYLEFYIFYWTLILIFLPVPALVLSGVKSYLHPQGGWRYTPSQRMPVKKILNLGYSHKLYTSSTKDWPKADWPL